MRLRLTIAYDGRPFRGWQSQPDASTVQDEIEKAIAQVAKQPLRIHGSGRTDTGVHALAQVAHFDAPEGGTMNPFNWVPALNCKLPAAIRIMACEEVAADFHSRFSAVGKCYHYELCMEPIMPPLRAGLAWHLPRGLDLAVLTEALGCLLGSHDFHAFAAYRGDEGAEVDWRRTIHQARVEVIADGYRIAYVGDGFLYKMVRLLTGAAVHVAQGRMEMQSLKNLLDQPAGLPFGKSPLCAPADGLYLAEVLYEKKSGAEMTLPER